MKSVNNNERPVWIETGDEFNRTKLRLGRISKSYAIIKKLFTCCIANSEEDRSTEDPQKPTNNKASSKGPRHW